MAKNIANDISEKAARDAEYRSRLRSDPKGVLAEELQAAGQSVSIPASVNVEVIEQAPNTVYIYIPQDGSSSDAGASATEANAEWSDSWVSSTFGTNVCKCH